MSVSLLMAQEKTEPIQIFEVEKLKVRKWLRVVQNSIVISTLNRIATDGIKEPLLLNCDYICNSCDWPDTSYVANDVVLVAGNTRHVGIGTFKPQVKLHLTPGFESGVSTWPDDQYNSGYLNYTKVDFLMSLGHLNADSGFYMYRGDSLMLLKERSPERPLFIENASKQIKIQSFNDNLDLLAKKNIDLHADIHILLSGVGGNIQGTAGANVKWLANRDFLASSSVGSWKGVSGKTLELSSIDTMHFQTQSLLKMNVTQQIESFAGGWEEHKAQSYQFYLHSYTVQPAVQVRHYGYAQSGTAPGILPMAVGIGTNQPRSHLDLGNRLTFALLPDTNTWILHNAYPSYNSNPSSSLSYEFHGYNPNRYAQAISFSKKGHIAIYVSPPGTKHFTNIKPAMIIDSLGRVLINVDPQKIKNMQHNLEVCGSVRAGEYWARDVAKWCDEVFYPDYSLEDWEERMEFIFTYHHLPGIPSEQWIRQNGFDLVEMSRAQLRHIEELYLYLNLYRKQVQALEQRVASLEQEVKELKRWIQKN